jgi:hypothetical protein
MQSGMTPVYTFENIKDFNGKNISVKSISGFRTSFNIRNELLRKAFTPKKPNKQVVVKNRLSLSADASIQADPHPFSSIKQENKKRRSQTALDHLCMSVPQKRSIDVPEDSMNSQDDRRLWAEKKVEVLKSETMSGNHFYGVPEKKCSVTNVRLVLIDDHWFQAALN